MEESKELKNSEEPKVEKKVKAEKTPKTEKSASKKGSGKTMMFLFVGLVGLVVLALGLTALVYVLTKPTKVSLEGKYSEDGAVDELSLYVKENMKVVLESIDFKKLDSESPEDAFDIEKMTSDISKLSGKLSLLSGENTPNPAGKTVHNAFDISFEYESESSDLVSVDMKMDLYTEYAKDYKPMGGSSVQDQVKMLSSITPEELEKQIGKSFMTITLDIDGKENGSMSADLELTLDGTEAYIKINKFDYELEDLTDAQKEDLEKVKLLEGNVVKVDLANFYEIIVESLNEVYGSTDMYGVPSTGLSDELLEQYKDVFAQAINEIETEDKDLLVDVGPKLEKRFAKMVDSYEFFSDVDEVDPVRESDDTVCQAGELNTEEILENTREGLLDMAKIVTDSKNYKQEQSYEDVAEELNETFDEYMSAIADSNFVMNLRLCSSESGKYLNGFGTDLSYSMDETKFKLSVDFLAVDSDSDFEISIPKADSDMTDEFNKLFEDSQVQDLLDPNLLDSSVDESTDRVMNDYDGVDYDAYLNEYAQIEEQYSNGEISDSEYYLLVNEINLKYGF